MADDRRRQTSKARPTASWVDTLPELVQHMHGYDVQQYAAELMGEKDMDADTLGRIKSDYREALSELHMN